MLCVSNVITWPQFWSSNWAGAVLPSCCRVYVWYGLTRPNISSNSVWNTYTKHFGRPDQQLSQWRVLPRPGWRVYCLHKSHTAPCGRISIQIIPTFSGFIILSYSLNLFAMSMILIDILSDILLCLFILLWIYLRSGVPQGSAYPMPTALAPKQTSDRRSNRTQIFASPMV